MSSAFVIETGTEPERRVYSATPTAGVDSDATYHYTMKQMPPSALRMFVSIALTLRKKVQAKRSQSATRPRALTLAAIRA